MIILKQHRGLNDVVETLEAQVKWHLDPAPDRWFHPVS